jgi:hypothetical protein
MRIASKRAEIVEWDVPGKWPNCLFFSRVVLFGIENVLFGEIAKLTRFGPLFASLLH